VRDSRADAQGQASETPNAAAVVNASRRVIGRDITSSGFARGSSVIDSAPRRTPFD
jgi:hypothetical protein